jgi:Flp pilus assembly protein TadG
MTSAVTSPRTDAGPTSIRSRSRRTRSEDGAAAVEFALVMPFLLLIVFGIIGYGFVFAQSLSLSNSARQAARSGVIEGTTCTQITTLAKESADTLGMEGSDTDVTIERGTSEGDATLVCDDGDGSIQPCKTQPPGTNVYVSLVHATQPVVPLVPIPDTVHATGVYRCEFQ